MTIQNYSKRAAYVMVAVITVATTLLQTNGTVRALDPQSCPTPFNEYAIPTPISNPQHIASVGGALWFSEATENWVGLAKLARITTDGVVTEFRLPGADRGSQVNSIVAGPDDAAWFSWANRGGGAIGRITSDGSLTQIPLGLNVRPFDMTLGPDGAFWTAMVERTTTPTFLPVIARVTTDGTVTKYPVVTTPATPNGTISAITEGPDGALWFTYAGNGDGSVSRIGRISMAGDISWFSLDSAYAHGSLGDIITGPDGALWFSGNKNGTGVIGRMATTGELTEYTDSRLEGSAHSFALGPDGALWFTRDGAMVARIDTLAPFHFDAYYAQISFPHATPRGIAAGPDGNMWFTKMSAGTIGRISTTLPTVATPENLTMPVPTTAPSLSWQPVTNAIGYMVCRDGQVISTVSQTNYTDNQVTAGDHYYTVIAFDAAGNYSSPSQGREITIASDTTSPTLSAPTWSAQPLLEGQNTTLSVIATDDESGISNVTYSVAGGSPQAMTYNSTTGGWEATFGANLAVNTYDIVITAFNGNGLESTPLFDVLAVYTAANGYVSGRAKLQPTVNDSMPIALDESKNPANVVLGFTNVVAGQTATGTFSLDYIIKKNQDEFSLSNAVVQWLVVPDSTHATVLGTADLVVVTNGVTTVHSGVTLRFDIALGVPGGDEVVIKIYDTGVNHASNPPTWMMNDVVSNSGIKIKP